MNRKKFILPIIVVAALVFTKCGSSDSSAVKQDSSSTHLNSPAPDNNSATNPSLADTAFQKDSAARKKDSMR